MKPTPKSVYEVLGHYRKINQAVDLNLKSIGKIMKFKSHKFKNMNYSCGNTVFKFDKDGVCSVQDQGYNQVDINTLINLGWLEYFVEELPVVMGYNQVESVSVVESPVVPEVTFEVKEVDPVLAKDLVTETITEIKLDESPDKLENNDVQDKPVKSKKNKKEV